MDGNLGRPEILKFINNLVKEMNFNIEDYLDKDTFMQHYNSGETFYQVSAYVRLSEIDGCCGTRYLEVIKSDKKDEFKAKASEINDAIKNFISELSDNEDIVPFWDKRTFLYFRRVPSDFGIDFSIFERNKKKENKKLLYCKCDNCGGIFSEPVAKTYKLYKEHPRTETEYTSPCCGVDYEEIYEEEE